MIGLDTPRGETLPTKHVPEGSEYVAERDSRGP